MTKVNMRLSILTESFVPMIELMVEVDKELDILVSGKETIIKEELDKLFEAEEFDVGALNFKYNEVVENLIDGSVKSHLMVVLEEIDNMIKTSFPAKTSVKNSTIISRVGIRDFVEDQKITGLFGDNAELSLIDGDYIVFLNRSSRNEAVSIIRDAIQLHDVLIEEFNVAMENKDREKLEDVLIKLTLLDSIEE